MTDKDFKLLQFCYLNVYPRYIIVAIGDVEDKVNKLWEPYDRAYNYLGPPPEDCAGITCAVKSKGDNPKYGYLVWMKTREDCQPDYIAHECCHAALSLFDHLGIKPDVKNQEPLAYLVGSMVQYIMDAIELKDLELKKKKKKTKDEKVSNT